VKVGGGMPDRVVLGRLWLAVAAYVVASGAFLQLIVLPMFFPSWEWGHGLLRRADSGTFHQAASDLAERIRSTGWSAWELRPDGHAPAGVAAVVYALTISEPWTLLPLNGALHATAAILLVVIVRRITRTRRWAATIPGFYLFAYGQMLLGDHDTWRGKPWRGAAAFALGAAGAVIVWAYRHYMAVMLLVAGLGAAGVNFVRWMAASRQGLVAMRQVFAAGAVSAALLGLLLGLSREGVGGSDDLGTEDGAVSAPSQAAESPAQDMWVSARWMPEALDRMLRSVARRRRHFVVSFPEAGSNIDGDVEFRDAGDIVAYAPRAVQVALLAPFPATWLEEGTLPSTTVMRRAAIPEMLVAYLALLGLPFATVRWRSTGDLWVGLILCLAMLAGYGLVVANVGTLYRMRYPYLMFLVALGLSSIGVALERRGHARRPDGSPGP